MKLVVMEEYKSLSGVFELRGEVPEPRLRPICEENLRQLGQDGHAVSTFGRFPRISTLRVRTEETTTNKILSGFEP